MTKYKKAKATQSINTQYKANNININIKGLNNKAQVKFKSKAKQKQ